MKQWLVLLSLALVGCSLAPAPLETPTLAVTPRARTPVPTVTPVPPTATPAPTDTLPPPTATPTPDPAHPLLGDLLFEFTFATSGIWGVAEDDAGKIAVVDGAMNLSLKTPDRSVWTYADKRAGDFYAEVSAQVLACSPDDAYGLMFRVVDAGNFYVLAVNCEARWRLRHLQDGEWSDLVGWTPATVIRSGAGAQNRLAVRAVADEFWLYVNGEYLGSAVDSSLAEGGLGLFAQSGAAAGASVSFDNLKVFQVAQ